MMVAAGASVAVLLFSDVLELVNLQALVMIQDVMREHNFLSYKHVK